MAFTPFSFKIFRISGVISELGPSSKVKCIIPVAFSSSCFSFSLCSSSFFLLSSSINIACSCSLLLLLLLSDIATLFFLFVFLNITVITNISKAIIITNIAIKIYLYLNK